MAAYRKTPRPPRRPDDPRGKGSIIEKKVDNYAVLYARAMAVIFDGVIEAQRKIDVRANPSTDAELVEVAKKVASHFMVYQLEDLQKKGKWPDGTGLTDLDRFLKMRNKAMTLFTRVMAGLESSAYSGKAAELFDFYTNAPAGPKPERER